MALASSEKTTVPVPPLQLQRADSRSVVPLLLSTAPQSHLDLPGCARMLMLTMLNADMTSILESIIACISNSDPTNLPALFSLMALSSLSRNLTRFVSFTSMTAVFWITGVLANTNPP